MKSSGKEPAQVKRSNVVNSLPWRGKGSADKSKPIRLGSRLSGNERAGVEEQEMYSCCKL